MTNWFIWHLSFGRDIWHRNNMGFIFKNVALNFSLHHFHKYVCLRCFISFITRWDGRHNAISSTSQHQSRNADTILTAHVWCEHRIYWFYLLNWTKQILCKFVNAIRCLPNEKYLPNDISNKPNTCVASRMNIQRRRTANVVLDAIWCHSSIIMYFMHAPTTLYVCNYTVDVTQSFVQIRRHDNHRCVDRKTFRCW